MKIEYFSDTDSLFIKLKLGKEAYGKEVERGIVFHYTDAGEVTAIEMDSRASKLADVSRLEIEGFVAGWGRPVAASESSLEGIVSRDPQVAGGEPVFSGTEVPVRDLIEHLKSGNPLIDFTAHSDTAVSREQPRKFLDWALQAARESAS